MSNTKGVTTPIVIVILVLAVLLLGYYYYQKTNAPGVTQTLPATNNSYGTPTTKKPGGAVTPTPKETENELYTVTLTDQGFTPASITVKAGEKVTFVNQSSGQMWVASAPHPTHTDLPGFDELTSVGNGGSYDYTFVKVGSWKYHNHLNPNQRGVVVVK